MASYCVILWTCIMNYGGVTNTLTDFVQVILQSCELQGPSGSVRSSQDQRTTWPTWSLVCHLNWFHFNTGKHLFYLCQVRSWSLVFLSLVSICCFLVIHCIWQTSIVIRHSIVVFVVMTEIFSQAELHICVIHVYRRAVQTTSCTNETFIVQNGPQLNAFTSNKS